MAVKPKNPFIVGGPVPSERHVGRKEEAETILALLAAAHGSSAVNGERRIGKTSFLHYLRARAPEWGLAPSTYQFVFMDAQSVQPFSEDAFWRYVIRKVEAADIIDPGFTSSLLQQPELEQYDLVDLFDRIGKKGKLIVLTLDEFDLIVSRVDPNSPNLLFNLRSLLNQPVRGLTLVTASLQPLNELCKSMNFRGSSPFYNVFRSVPLGRFTPKECNDLVDIYLQDAGIDFTEADRRLMIEKSEGHPYLLQRACAKLFDYYLQSGQEASTQ